MTWQAEGSRPSWDAQAGQGMVEYALILVLVSVVAIVLFISISTRLTNMYSDVVVGLNH